VLSPNSAEKKCGSNTLTRQGTIFPRSLNGLSCARDGRDDVLLQRITAGDQLAMKALFVRHRDRVFRFILRLVKDEDVAEEALIETFFEVWRSADRFERRSTFATWLLAIARHKALSAIGRATSVGIEDEVITAIPDLSEDPEAALQAKDLNGILQGCVSRLSAKHTEIIDLVYYHEKTIAEAARALRLPEATVKTRMFYARRKLADLVSAKLNGGSPWVS
jgi:RNA polymerase sigma-70 factor, ECF subfamily